MNTHINLIIGRLKKEAKRWRVPIITAMHHRRTDPFRILISTVLSTRTKDETTEAASARLFAIAKTPGALLRLSRSKIERAIYPVGFYKTKAKNVKTISKIILKKYAGRVPHTLEELMTLPGVGRKVANLVMTRGFGLDGICVDTHVHRISNRWGYVRTKTPHETEMTLRRKLPRRYWIIYNDLLVAFGQTICKPVSPFCSRCPVAGYCKKIGVTTHR
ncbi:MAG: endonuclease III [Candidatus Omnitrophica bacterium]|nr:endonuclease III [Candidatus Omnitrophota bacterium]